MQFVIRERANTEHFHQDEGDYGSLQDAYLYRTREMADDYVALDVEEVFPVEIRIIEESSLSIDVTALGQQALRQVARYRLGENLPQTFGEWEAFGQRHRDLVAFALSLLLEPRLPKESP